MPNTAVPRSVLRRLNRAVLPSGSQPTSRTATRCLHQYASSITASPLRSRPGSQRWAPSVSVSATSTPHRTMFIQTEPTPNPDALKFNPNQRVLPENIKSPFLEYTSPRSTLAPPHPSPLAAKLLNVDGVTSVFLGTNFITVTKDSATPWAHVKPDVFSIINEFMTSGQTIVSTVEDTAGESGQEGTEIDSLAYDENDDEVVGMIKELLETRIRPAIQEDGGDIEFRGFHDGQVLLRLRGACRTCDSSTVTLKNGIESMLMHYIEEVKGVQQVLDANEELNNIEFAKFEEKLRQQKGYVPPSTSGKGSLDTVE